MEREDIERALERFRAELTDAEQEANAAIQRRDSLRQVVTGFEGLLAAKVSPGHRQLAVADSGNAVDSGTVTVRITPSGTEGATPTGAEAVRQVLRDAARPQSLREIMDELRRRGWMSTLAKHPEASVRSSLQRLVGDREVTRVARGTYQLNPASPGDTEMR